MILDRQVVLMKAPIWADVADRLVVFHLDIGLSTQQLLDILAIKKDWRQNYLDMAVDLRQKGQEIDALFDARPVDDVLINQKIDEYITRLNQGMKAFARVLVDADNVLTPVQSQALMNKYNDEKATDCLDKAGYF